MSVTRHMKIVFCTLWACLLVDMADNGVIKFVQLVKNYPCLYNHSLSEYSHKDIPEKAWHEIAQEIK